MGPRIRQIWIFALLFVATALLAAFLPRLRSPVSLSKPPHLEASGMIYLEDEQRFLVVSDDTGEGDPALFFVVGSDGSVEDTVEAHSVAPVTDLESISQDGEYVYALSSQSLSKKGRNKPERNGFIRFRRDGLSLSKAEKVELKPYLMQALKKDPALAALFPDLDKGDFEIEGHFMEEGNMYLAFKNPLTAVGDNLVLELRDFARLFSHRQIVGLKLWGRVNLKAAGQVSPHHLSELIRVDGELFAASVCEDESCGSVWRLHEVNGRLEPEELAAFTDLKPEGLAWDGVTQSLFVSFDRKSLPSHFQHIVVPPPHAP